MPSPLAESSVIKFQIIKQLLFGVYLKEPGRKMWIKIQMKTHKRTFPVTNEIFGDTSIPRFDTDYAESGT